MVRKNKSSSFKGGKETFIRVRTRLVCTDPCVDSQSDIDSIYAGGFTRRTLRKS